MAYTGTAGKGFGWGTAALTNAVVLGLRIGRYSSGRPLHHDLLFMGALATLMLVSSVGAAVNFRNSGPGLNA